MRLVAHCIDHAQKPERLVRARAELMPCQWRDSNEVAQLDCPYFLAYEAVPVTAQDKHGMHVFVPLEPRYSYEQVRSFAQALATLAAAERPDLFTTPRSVARREKDKVYFDWQQIAEGKTIAAPYVLRAYPGAPVATPLAWREVTRQLRPEQFHIGNALNRFDRVGDLFEGVLKRPQRLEKAVEKLA